MIKSKTQFGFAILFVMLFFFSCQKEDTIIDTRTSPPPPTNQFSDPINEFVIAQNYLIEVINIVLTKALFSPELHGIAPDDIADDRDDCPDVSFETISGQGTLMTIDFGVDDMGNPCEYIHPDGGVSSPITGTVTLLASNLDITFPNNTVKIRFDELICGDKKIEFIGGFEPTRELAVKFNGNLAAGNFSYGVFLDGQVDADNNGDADPDPLNTDILGKLAFEMNRAHFKVTCLAGNNANNSTLIYPSYSGATVFDFVYENGGAAPMFNYGSLVAGCYTINTNKMTGFYYDSNGVLLDDYRIIKDDNFPILYKPNCKWIMGGRLTYDDIPPFVNDMGMATGEVYHDGSRDLLDIDQSVLIPANPVNDDPSKKVFYGIDINNDPLANQCDGWVRVESCDEIASGGGCESGALVSRFECP